MGDERGTPSDPSGEVVFTIGHSNRDLQEFLDLLVPHGIEEIVDVRRFPGSRRNPHFKQEPLSASLAEAGIGYKHMPELGGRRGSPDPESPNGAWRVAAFQAYADRMAEPEWIAALEELAALARRRTVAYMCAEAVPWRCHRRLISDALTVRGFEVRDIIGAGRADVHRMPDFARVISPDRIVYPPSQEPPGHPE